MINLVYTFLTRKKSSYLHHCQNYVNFEQIKIRNWDFEELLNKYIYENL